MSKEKTKSEIIAHSEQAINSLKSLLDSYISSEDYQIVSKADKLSYWLEDYSKFLNFEPKFVPAKLKKYKRGEIVKVHLGYNIGSEEGGLHYCVILDKKNSLNNPVVTVVPLTSIKSNTDITKLHLGSVYLGNSIYTAMFSKLSSLKKLHIYEIEQLKSEILLIKNSIEAENLDEIQQKNCLLKVISIRKKIEDLSKKQSLIDKVALEIKKMKKGSIALVSQITTISKIRIFDPKSSFDVLADIKLSNENLDLIDKEIKNLFLK